MSFDEQALTPALKKYEKKLFSSRTILNQHSLTRLKSIYDALELCLQNHLGTRLEQVQTKGREIMEALEQQYNKEGLTLALIQGGFNAAIEVASENNDMLVIAIFMAEFHHLVTNPQRKTSDLIGLKELANETKENLLTIPEIREVKQFHWLINMFCNFVNDYILYAFESQQAKDVNRFFTKLNSEIREAENQEILARIASSKSIR